VSAGVLTSLGAFQFFFFCVGYEPGGGRDFDIAFCGGRADAFELDGTRPPVPEAGDFFLTTAANFKLIEVGPARPGVAS
jgi:hypothetical protein